MERKLALLESRFSVNPQTTPATESEEDQENKQQQQSHPQSNSASKSQNAFPLLPSSGVPERIVMEEEESRVTSSSRSQIYTITTNDAENRGDTEAEQKPTNALKTLKRKMSIPPQIASEGSPKVPKSDEHEREMVITESGSRGAAGGPKRSILSYFPVQGEKHTLSSGVFPNGNPPSSSSSASAPIPNAPSSGNAAGAGDVIVSPSSGKEGTTASKSHRSNTSSSHHNPSSKSTTSAGTSSSSASSSSSSSSSSSITTTAGIEAKKQLEATRVAKDLAESKCLRLESDLKATEDRQHQLEERNSKLCKSLEEVHRAAAWQDAHKRRDRLALDCVRLGKIVSMRMGVSVQDVWEEGYALNEWKRRSAELLERKEELEKRKKKLQNMKRVAKRGSSSSRGVSGSASSSSSVSGGSSNLAMSAPELPTASEDEPYEVDLDLSAEEEAIKSHLDQLKKDETALHEERRMLEEQKAVHQKEIKRCQSEDRSRFTKNLPCLHGRYLLLCMLGRGGFSEVWKALDLVELREVAVKIHELNPIWSEEHKQRYIKNVTREYKIHREMRHPRVVEFYDVFEIDVNSFATVLEYCRGIDLDEKLKRCRLLPEREARTILMQIVSGLRYLNTPGGVDHNGEDGGASNGGGGNDAVRRKAIIHYDLKPANILFDEHGDAKITDFGLSKIVEETHEGTSMELTSQGAGTYWYLPPECFGAGDARISSKVDVWSVGVIFYQMLYGSKPFGEGKRQEVVLSEGIIRNATKVEFPNNDPRAPKVTDEAKDLIKACLEVDQRYRPHVHELCQHAYLKHSIHK